MLDFRFDFLGQYGHWNRGSLPHSIFLCRTKLLWWT